MTTLFAPPRQMTEDAPVIVLPDGALYKIGRDGQTVSALNGTLWVTFDGCDVFVEPGEQCILPNGTDTAVISGLRHETVKFSLS